MSQSNQTTNNRLHWRPIDLLFLALVLLTGAIWLAFGGLQRTAADGVMDLNVGLAEDVATGSIIGTVEAGADGTKLENIRVTVFQEDNGTWQRVGAKWTAADGSFDWSGLLPGTYHVYFYDESGDYLDEFHLNAHDQDTAEDIPVTAGSTYIINARLATAGHITGEVTVDVNGQPLAGIRVEAYEEVNGQWNLVFSATTTANGTYNLGDLRTKTYRVKFSPTNGTTFLEQWYDNSPDLAGATGVAAHAGQVTTGIDAALAAPPPDNDDFDNAIEILAFPYSDTRNVIYATTAVDDPLLPCGSNNAGVATVWYKVTPEQNGYLTAGAYLYDTILTVWEGTRGSLSAVACNDDFDPNSDEVYSQVVAVPVSAQTTYYIEIAGYAWDNDEWPIETLYMTVDFVPESAVQNQENALHSGWNLISSFIEPQNPAMEAVLADIENDVVLVKNGDGEVYWPEINFNTIGDWDVRDGYLIYMNNPATLITTGSTVDPAQTPLDLPAGWNQMAYLRDAPLAVDQALDSISGQLYLLKDSSGQIYWPAYGVNQIGDLQPGQGYQIYMNSAGILNYPGN